MSRKWLVEILWDTGITTRVRMDRREKGLLDRFGVLYIHLKYELVEAPTARPVDYRIVESE